MNTIITSKQAILEVSRNLIREQGWNAINIRSVASACNVAVGSIYNYFSSKSELAAATVESIWHDIFQIPDDEETFHSFSNCIEWIYQSMEKGGEKYPNFFSFHSMSFLGEEKPQGKQFMKQSWIHIQNKLYTVLMHDSNVRPDAFDENFTPHKFTELVFSLILSSLLQQNYDCSTILEVVHRSIYK